jgi:CRP-like cAMP-binding protein
MVTHNLKKRWNKAMTRDEKETGDRPTRESGLAKALNRLTAEQVSQISPKFIREIYAPGTVIIRQGEPPDRFYIIIRGQAEVSHQGQSGQRATVDRRVPGEYFGEIGLLHNQPRSATVAASAEGELELLALNREDFLALIDESRGTEAQVAQEMIRRLINLADFQ